MTPLTKTITAVLLIGLFATSVACEAKTNTKKKFHLIYLVSAEKLEVGAKVFVEPLFYTDGNIIKPIYEECRNKKYLNKKYWLQDKFVMKYCLNNPINLGGEEYSIVNNSGVRIRLNEIVFKSNNDKQELPESGISTIKSIFGKSDTSFSGYTSNKKHTLQHFFFMSKNRNLLNSIMSKDIYKKAQISSLIKKAKKLANMKKGFHKSAGFKEIGPSPGYSNKPHLVAPILADFDGDKKIDIAVGMRLQSNDNEFNWYAIGIIFASGKMDYMGASFQKIVIISENKRGISLLTPLGVIKLKKCRYMIYRPGDLGAVYFSNLQRNKSICKGVGTRKTMEAIQGPEKG